MCRRSDRIEAVVLLVCVAAVLIAAVVGVQVGAAAAARAERHAGTARAGTTPHRAVLLHDAPAPSWIGTDPAIVAADVPVRARWHTADGVRTGTVRVPAGARAGARVTVWFDRRGRQAEPPESRLGTAMDGVGPGLAVASGTAAGAALLVLVTRWLLDRRRVAGWDRDWSRIEPIWTNRPSGT